MLTSICFLNNVIEKTLIYPIIIVKYVIVGIMGLASYCFFLYYKILSSRLPFSMLYKRILLKFAQDISHCFDYKTVQS